MVERVTTGIPGLDDLIDGGFPTNSATLVSGGAGTGKTIFCCQYLWEGLQKDEKCLYITMEEDADEIVNDAKEFGWDFAQYSDRFTITYLNPFSTQGGFADKVRELIQENNVDRVVLDSTSIIGMHTNNKAEVRKQLYELVRELRSMDTTSLLTAEIPKSDSGMDSRYGVEEFVTDGLIVLDMSVLGKDAERTLRVSKMRETDMEGGINTLEIEDDGLYVE